jgi:hypothetical protein
MNRRTTHDTNHRPLLGAVLTLLTLALAFFTIALSAHAQMGGGGSRPRARAASRRAPVGQLTGLMVGVHTLAAPGVSIDGEDIRDDFHTNLGGGAGIMVGYGFTPMFTLFTSVDLAKQGSGMDDLEGSFGLAHVELGARLNIPTSSGRTVPYVRASVGHRALGARVRNELFDDETQVSLSGSIVSLGGGFQHWVSPTLALDGGAALAYGKFGHLEEDGDEQSLTVNGSKSIRLHFGFTWHP